MTTRHGHATADRARPRKASSLRKSSRPLTIARSSPAVMLDHVAGRRLSDRDWTARTSASCNIRSVYDIDGVVATALGGIDAVRDPSTPATQRAPRGSSASRKPCRCRTKTCATFRNTAFGPRGRGRGMRDILGYAPVEPDGSVKVKVPANVPFMISMLDAQRPAHRAAAQQLAAGRPGRRAAVQRLPQSATARRSARTAAKAVREPSTRARLRPACFRTRTRCLMDSRNKTMAETRWTVMCDRAPPAERGGNCELSVNLMFDDIWTTAAPTRLDACYVEGATNFGSSPSDLTLKHVCTTDAGVQHAAANLPGCATTGRALPNHDPLRAAHSPAVGARPRTCSNRTIRRHPAADHRKCTNCHAPVNPANTAMAAVPAGQLDLTDGPSDRRG